MVLQRVGPPVLQRVLEREDAGSHIEPCRDAGREPRPDERLQTGRHRIIEQPVLK